MIILSPIRTSELTSVIDIADLARWLRVDETSEVIASDLNELVMAGMLAFEGKDYANQPLFAGEFVANAADFSGGWLKGINPKITAINYRASGVDYAVADTDYWLDSPAYLTFAQNYGYSFSRPMVTVNYTAGWAQEDVPADVKLALRRYVADAYDSRGNQVAERVGIVQKIMENYRHHYTV